MYGKKQKAFYFNIQLVILVKFNDASKKKQKILKKKKLLYKIILFVLSVQLHLVLVFVLDF